MWASAMTARERERENKRERGGEGEREREGEGGGGRSSRNASCESCFVDASLDPLAARNEPRGAAPHERRGGTRRPQDRTRGQVPGNRRAWHAPAHLIRPPAPLPPSSSPLPLLPPLFLLVPPPPSPTSLPPPDFTSLLIAGHCRVRKAPRAVRGVPGPHRSEGVRPALFPCTHSPPPHTHNSIVFVPCSILACHDWPVQPNHVHDFGGIPL